MRRKDAVPGHGVRKTRIIVALALAFPLAAMWHVPAGAATGVDGCLQDPASCVDAVTDPLPDPVSDVVEDVKDTVDVPDLPVPDVEVPEVDVPDTGVPEVDEIVEPVEDSVNDVVSNITGEGTDGGGGGGDGDGTETSSSDGDGSDRSRRGDAAAARRRARARAAASSEPVLEPASGAAAAVIREASTPPPAAPTSATKPATPSLAERLGRAAGEVGRRFAFPLGLALAVGAYLLLQGRLDRRDPKLALAPIDSRDDYLVFE